MVDISLTQNSLQREISERTRASEKWQNIIQKKWWLLAVLSFIFVFVVVLLVAGINKAVESNKTKSGAKFGSGVKNELLMIQKQIETAETNHDELLLQSLQTKFKLLESVFGTSGLQQVVGSQIPITTMKMKLNSTFSSSRSLQSSLEEELKDEPFKIVDRIESTIDLKKKDKTKLKPLVKKANKQYE